MGVDEREQLGSELVELVRAIKPDAKSDIELEKLKAGLSIIVEDQRAKIADASADAHTWLDITKGVTPLIVTALLGAAGSVVTLVYQSKQHAADAERQQEDAKAAAARQDQELQATQEAKALEDRTELLQRLAQSLAGAPVPAASCWYAEGIWADYAKDDPLPQVLASRCISADAGADASADAGAQGVPAGAAGQWVAVVESTGSFASACAAADHGRAAGLQSVQVLRENGQYVTTAGGFSTRPAAIGYLQRVRSVRGNALIARRTFPAWQWCDCAKEPPLACDGAGSPSPAR